MRINLEMKHAIYFVKMLRFISRVALKAHGCDFFVRNPPVT